MTFAVDRSAALRAPEAGARAVAGQGSAPDLNGGPGGDHRRGDEALGDQGLGDQGPGDQGLGDQRPGDQGPGGDGRGDDAREARAAAPADGPASGHRVGGVDPEGAGRAEFAFSRRLVCLSDADGAAAASYRALQVHLTARHLRDGRRGLAICSPVRGAGCTTVAANLAIACAQAGINTLLIDANLLRPAVQDFIRPAHSAGGLAQMLLSASEGEQDHIQRAVRPNLSVLFAGSLPTGAHDLLARPRFKKIVDQCIRSFELVIVDTPSGEDGGNARHAAMAIRYALLVARRDVTLVATIKEAAAEFANDRVSLVGAFLNDF